VETALSIVATAQRDLSSCTAPQLRGNIVHGTTFSLLFSTVSKVQV